MERLEANPMPICESITTTEKDISVGTQITIVTN